MKPPVLSRALLFKYQDANHTHHSVQIQGTHNSLSPNAMYLCSFCLHGLSWSLIAPSLLLHLFQLPDAHITSSTHGDTNTLCQPHSSSHMHQKPHLLSFTYCLHSAPLLLPSPTASYFRVCFMNHTIISLYLKFSNRESKVESVTRRAWTFWGFVQTFRKQRKEDRFS